MTPRFKAARRKKLKFRISCKSVHKQRNGRGFSENAESAWDSIFEAGKHLKIRPFGMHALEMTRIEAGFIQTNTDFMAAEDALRPIRMRSPYEIGMGWLVHFKKKKYFIGKKALKYEKENSTTER